MSTVSIKKKQFIFLLVALMVYVGSSYFWMNCIQSACSESLIDNYISTFKMAGIVLFCFSMVFLFLPSKYFTAWFKYIFLWAFPLSVFIVATAHNETMGFSIPKANVVRLLGIIFGGITILFVIVQWFLYRNL